MKIKLLYQPVLNNKKLYIVTNLNYAIILSILLLSCSPKVSIISNNQENHLSGRWNAADSRNTGIEIANQILSAPWLINYAASFGGKKPVVICGTILNRSHEHINAETFRKDIELALVNSNKVSLVQDAQNRLEIRDERAEQHQFASKETQKQLASETGADFILQGSINSVVDENRKKRVVTYQINLSLTDIQSNEIVWIGEKKITKAINR